MMSKETGGPAFPKLMQDERWKTFTSTDGMTLRDYFATHASDEDILVALSSINKVERVRELDGGRREVFYGLPDNARQIARYMVADAMLKASKQ